MRLRVGEPERRAPRAAEHQPALDAEVLAQLLHVRDQVPGGVVDQTGVRPAASAAALIEQHDAIRVRIEKAPGAIVAAGAGAAVHEDRRLALGVAAFLVVDLVHRRHAQHAALVRLDRWIQRAQAGGRLRPAACAWPARRDVRGCVACFGADLRTLRRGVLRLLAISLLRTGSGAHRTLQCGLSENHGVRNTRCSLTSLPSSCCWSRW